MNTNKNDANCTTPTNSRYATNSNLIPQNSQNMTGDQQNSHLHNNYQTANTPTSIPEIVFSGKFICFTYSSSTKIII